MIILTIRNSHLRTVIILLIMVLAVSIIINKVMRNEQNQNKLNYLNELVGPPITTFMNEIILQNRIEIFDIEKGQVIKETQSNTTVIKEAEKILESIVGIYIKSNAFPEKGYIIKVPFEPKLKVKNHFLTNYDIEQIDKIFILLPEKDVPLLLVLDDKERPHFYYFNRQIDKLLESLELNINNIE